MRRVLIVDDPRLAPRLARLRESLGGAWDLLFSPADQKSFWNEADLLRPEGRAATTADLDSLIAAGESIDLVVAASMPELLKVASQLAFRRGSVTAVLPAAAQTADWIFSLYPLSEGAAPRVRGVFEHRAAPAVRAFALELPGSLPARHLISASTVPADSLTGVEIEARFLEDVDLFRQLAGEFKELFAIAIPAETSGQSRSISLTLRGEGVGSVSASITPGNRSQMVLKPGDGCRPSLTRKEDGSFCVEGNTFPASGNLGSPYAPWQDVLRTFDDLSAMRRSLKRRRLVELQTETISERAQFKSLMSASGCGLLVATLFGAVALLAAGAAFDPRASLQRTSERAGLVLRTDDFQSATTELSDDAAAEWPGMTRRLSHTAAPILVEKSDDASLDGRRVEQLATSLAAAGVASPTSRIELYEFRGGLFVRLLTACWVLLFLPLGLFLAFQAFLLVAPTQSSEPPGAAAS
ncbi:hypothetical protein Pan44_15540 [Caulifigura coniformis]|uniref:Uncharacterized protein n=1 Tax=Caulifigura coniformis TaxID=2527983 RepID=A0A517SBP0_9PLAN|nr:hypothetical protein [Caulifigura coniformis]QDT53532.1 hypothetical protein Pan44_15540 [Caulifigura coniformis]